MGIKKGKQIKTNAARILERHGIAFELLTYQVDEDALGAVSVASELGVAAEVLLKTIVTRGDGGRLFVFCVPGPCELDLKKAARLTGSRRIELLPSRELFQHTGYIRGGCSPLAMKGEPVVYIEETALMHERVLVSAGVRGAQIRLDPRGLAAVCGAEFVDVV